MSALSFFFLFFFLLPFFCGGGGGGELGGWVGLGGLDDSIN